MLVSKADFKFNCAHFVAYNGFRERLHGHNYTISVKITGSDCVGNDGYVIDFGVIKKAARNICKSMNEYFICPMKSTDMKVLLLLVIVLELMLALALLLMYLTTLLTCNTTSSITTSNNRTTNNK